MIMDGKIADSDRRHEKTLSRKGRKIDLWYSGKKKDSAGTSRPCSTRTASQCGFLTCCRANVNDLAAARESVLAELRLFVEDLQPWPMAATKAQVTAS